MRVLACLLILFLIFSFSSVHAQNAKREPLSHIGVQVIYHAVDKHEMEQDGFLLAVQYNLTYEMVLFYMIEGYYAFGEVDSKSDTRGTLNNKDYKYYDNRLLIGIPIFKTNNSKMMLYTGAGYRFLSDDSQNRLTSTGEEGYLIEAKYFYSPLGGRLSYKFNNEWAINAEVEYNYFVYGENKSLMGEIANREDIKNEQNEGFGYRFAVGLSKTLNNRTYDYRIYYRIWDIETSDSVTDSYGETWTEPDTDIYEIGISASIMF